MHAGVQAGEQAAQRAMETLARWVSWASVGHTWFRAAAVGGGGGGVWGPGLCLPPFVFQRIDIDRSAYTDDDLVFRLAGFLEGYDLA